MQAMDGRVEVSFRRRRMTPSIAAGRAGKARCPSTRMCEFAPARVRREAQESRANRMLARPSCPAPMALVTFPERKVTRAVGRRGKRHGCRNQSEKAAHFVRDPSPAALRATTSPTRGRGDSPKHLDAAFWGGRKFDQRELMDRRQVTTFPQTCCIGT